MIEQVNAREVVLDMLLEVIEGDRYCHTVLFHTLKKYQYLEKQERAFISRICTGTVKRYLTLDYIINQYASLPVHKMKPLIRNLLRLSVYQIFFMDQVPVSAVCNEAVKLAKKRGFIKLSGFVNGILRTIARNVESFVYPNQSDNPIAYLSVVYSIPEWIVTKLLEQYDFDTVEKILIAALKEKETTIRCNQSKISPEKLKAMLQEDGVTVEDSEYLPYAFKIKDYDYLEKLSAFQLGYFFVQDVSSMLVCQVAGIKENDFVVDVCAAPGGKATHAAELARKVSARDLTEFKISLIKENSNRLGFLNIETLVWDATELDPDIVEQADVVIADLPCSGMGVFGKKPDIKYKLTQKQQTELVTLQKVMLQITSQYVKVGGVLIFSTCTMNNEENIDNLRWFLHEFDYEAESIDPYLPVSLHGETTKLGYLQLIPGIHNSDGFFLARLRRKS